MPSKYEMWVVTKGPSDYPNYKYVIRQWEGGKPTDEAILVENDTKLTLLQTGFLRKGFGFVKREPNDDPVIVGTWLRLRR